MMMTPRQAAARLAALLALDDSPWRVALALAVGVFISFTPLWGFQTLLALLVATLCRLNRAVTVAGTWLNLPWFAPFVYAGALKLGSVILPELSGLAGLSAWLFLGTTTLGFAAAALTWMVAYAVMRVRRARRRRADAGASRRAA
jgi:uncharacterized protein (DUF2062 family)